nr:alpha-1,2-fucosyltransferase [Hoeflea prorocentri]
MFQYACGRALALRTGSEIVLDTRDFVAGPGQRPGLHHLNIVNAKVPDRDLPPSKKQKLRYLLWRGLGLPPKFVRQNGAAFDPQIIGLPADVWLHGYWQSERFFADFKEEIRKELSVKTEPDETNARLFDEIMITPAASLHIRRGDYVSDPKANAVHGICSLAYYENAASLIARTMGQEPVFYVFSDEPGWVADNLRLPYEMRIVSHNGAKNYEDLRLMSACRHHVVANSSFSWWGAWLNPSPEKLVVAPARWFADPSAHNPDIVPEDWVRLEG